MPDTWARWGFDANGDGVADPWNAEDAIYSAARYLAATGGATDIRAQFLVQPRTVVRRRGAAARAAVPGRRCDLLGRARRRPGGPRRGQASRDRYESKLLDAQAELTDLQAEPTSCWRRRSPSRISAKGSRDRSLTCRLRRAGGAGRRGGAPGRVAERPGRTRAARDQASGAAFAVGAGRCSAPRRTRTAMSFRSAAARVSCVGHTHHDYPAADIAAPEGSQLYALSNGTVTGRLARAGGELRHRLHDRDHRRPDLDVLPPVLPRAGGRAGRVPRRRPAGRPRRRTGHAKAHTFTSSSIRRPAIRRTSRGSSPSPARPSAGGLHPDGAGPARSSPWSATRKPAPKPRRRLDRLRAGRLLHRNRGLSPGGSCRRNYCDGLVRASFVALTVVWLFATAALTFAAAHKMARPLAAAPVTRQLRRPPRILVVPDLRRQAFVFSKGTLTDAGFSCRIRLREGLPLEHGRLAVARSRHARGRHRRAARRPSPLPHRRAARVPGGRLLRTPDGGPARCARLHEVKFRPRSERRRSHRRRLRPRSQAEGHTPRSDGAAKPKVAAKRVHVVARPGVHRLRRASRAAERVPLPRVRRL